MQILDLDSFEALADDFDRVVYETPDIDHFCSSSTWIMPANTALMPPREPWIRRGDAGYVALMRGEHDAVGRYLQPLEAAWCFTSPLAGEKPLLLAQDFYHHCLDQPKEWDVLLLGGIQLESRLMAALLLSFGQTYRVFTGMMTRRHLASLEGGVEGFLSRRSANFRKGLRKSHRKLKGAQLTFEACAAPEPSECQSLFDRILAIEAGSWKGLAEAGIGQGTMRAFYRAMLPRLAASGQLRLRFAQHDGKDVGFILGAVHGTTYRGLQFSFDDQYRELGLGNLLQMDQIHALVAEGVDLYDLGSDAPYKARWAEQQMDTHMVIIRP